MNHKNAATSHSIPSIIVVDNSNSTTNIDQSYNVNIGGHNGLNLLINYQNNNNIIQAPSKKSRYKKRFNIAGTQTHQQNKPENPNKNKGKIDALELAISSSPITRISRMPVSKTKDQIKEFVERDLSFESVERANEKRGLDLT